MKYKRFNMNEVIKSWQTKVTPDKLHIVMQFSADFDT